MALLAGGFTAGTRREAEAKEILHQLMQQRGFYRWLQHNASEKSMS